MWKEEIVYNRLAKLILYFCNIKISISYNKSIYSTAFLLAHTLNLSQDSLSFASCQQDKVKESPTKALKESPTKAPKESPTKAIEDKESPTKAYKEYKESPTKASG